MKFFTTIILGFFCLTSSQAFGTETPKQTQKAKALRIGGDYIVKTIEKKDDGTFTVFFKSKTPSNKGDHLKLETDHIHMNIKEGDQLRLSAEILTQTSDVWEVSQVVLFIPKPEGPTPVWVLSNKSKGMDLKATDYLKMHYPQSDYMIF